MKWLYIAGEILGVLIIIVFGLFYWLTSTPEIESVTVTGDTIQQPREQSPQGKKDASESGSAEEKEPAHEKRDSERHDPPAPSTDAGDNSAVSDDKTTDSTENAGTAGSDVDAVDTGVCKEEVAAIRAMPNVPAHSPSIILCGFSPDLPEKGEMSIEILSEPVAGAASFEMLCPDIHPDHGIPEIPELKIKFPLTMPSAPSSFPLVFRNKSVGEYKLQLYYRVKEQVWKSKEIVITAHEIDSVRIIAVEWSGEEPYLVAGDDRLQLVMMALAAGGVELGPVDPSLSKWEVLPFDESSGGNGAGSISGQGLYSIDSHSEKHTDTPRLVTLSRIRGTYKQNGVSAEVVVGAIGDNRTEFTVTNEELAIAYTSGADYSDCEIHTEDWRWKKNDKRKTNAQVELSADGPCCRVKGISGGHGRLYCKVWLAYRGKTSNKVDGCTPIFVVDDSNVFFTRESGADTIFTLSNEGGGKFRIVAGCANEYLENGEWFKKVRVSISGGEVLDEGFVLPVWKTVGSKRIYSRMFSFSSEQAKNGAVFTVTNTDGK